MKTYSIKTLLEGGGSFLENKVLINAWVRAFRSYRFIALNDGSTIKDLQVVVDSKFSEEFLKKITIGAALKISGLVVKSRGKEQTIEVLAEKIKIYSETSPEVLQGTILQPKRHSLEKLREQAHLRFRTKFFSAVMRIRHQLAFSVHKYFHKRGFLYVHTPIITASDAEGAGEMFRVTSLDLKKLPRNSQGQIDESQDFFGRSTHLTVSGQLEGESAAMALGKIYTFGPTFRAENSNTSRHLAEFWMIEPEVAFYELSQNMDLAEDFLKYLIGTILEHCTEDLDFLNQRFVEEQKQKPKHDRLENTLVERLEFVNRMPFIRLSYSEAIKILLASKTHKKGQFKHTVKWGMDLQSEHERYLVEKHFRAPLILFDYPVAVKAFYMRLNEDEKTVRAMDVLFPGLGEIIGGSQREERYEILLKCMKELDIDEKLLWWYLDTRRFGSAPHSGFGLGFERLVQFVTGMSNIRDVIPFPRTPKNAEF
ncbi:asparagine--tRNA ligase [Bacteroidetes bacterium endosymbiont of Geopemphigus sp.]|uniref:asparagine--tRNA ligase n=1 Tax=Bacteroidetes bacterium endosymbiont of Geopemphigus sp. TaxID=2047937 RepID=UPI000CD0DD95|nr:asparagine--tRNA ligase [Bacteroidetes bacterium endosymbiont of Geopemphigus sp.]